MNIKNQLDKRMIELRRVAWSSLGSCAEEQDALDFKTFLHRCASFLSDRKVAAHPFLDLSEFVAPSTYIEELERSADALTHSCSIPLGRRVARNYLLELLINEKESVYEPLIRIFERKGKIDYQHGEAIVDHWTLPLQDWIERFKTV